MGEARTKREKDSFCDFPRVLHTRVRRHLFSSKTVPLRTMKVFALATFLAATVAALAAAAPTPLEYEHEFAAWLEQHDLVFEDPLVYVKKMETYIANDVFIRHHNAHSNTSFTLGHNEFSHLTFDEFAAMKKGFQMPEGYLEKRLQKTQTNASIAAEDAPASVDWVEKGAVTAVKNQGQCG